MTTFYYVFYNESFWGYYTVNNFHNNVMYSHFIRDEKFKVYSVIVEY